MTSTLQSGLRSSKLGFLTQLQRITSISVTDAIVRSFNKNPNMFLVESDNYKGNALDRLQIWKELFSSKVVPFSLSNDQETNELNVAGEKLDFSHVIFKPNVFVSTHALRTYQKGSVLKNLGGKEGNIKRILTLRAKRCILKIEKNQKELVYWPE